MAAGYDQGVGRVRVGERERKWNIDRERKYGRGAERLVNHRLTHCLGGAVSRWVQSMHRFSTLNNSTIRDRVARRRRVPPSVFERPAILCKTTN